MSLHPIETYRDQLRRERWKREAAVLLVCAVMSNYMAPWSGPAFDFVMFITGAGAIAATCILSERIGILRQKIVEGRP